MLISLKFKNEHSSKASLKTGTTVLRQTSPPCVPTIVLVKGFPTSFLIYKLFCFSHAPLRPRQTTPSRKGHPSTNRGPPLYLIYKLVTSKLINFVFTAFGQAPSVIIIISRSFRSKLLRRSHARRNPLGTLSLRALGSPDSKRIQGFPGWRR